jgi:uncharacterized membrane protein (DUF485 family)
VDGGLITATPDVVDSDAIVRDPRFESLQRRKSLFFWGLMLLSVAYGFLLPNRAAHFRDMFRSRVCGVINVGLLCALSGFIVAWVIVLFNSRAGPGRGQGQCRYRHVLRYRNLVHGSQDATDGAEESGYHFCRALVYRRHDRVTAVA